MRILLINYEYPPLGGGGGVASKKIVDEYVKQGHIVDCITSKFNDLPKVEVVNGVNVYRVFVFGKREQFSAGLLTLLSFPVCAFWQALKLSKNSKYDVIHTHFAVPSGPLGIAISKIRKIPVFLFLHGADVYDPTKKYSPHRSRLLRLVVNYVLNSSSRVIAQSSDTKKRVLNNYRCNKEVEIIPLAYDVVDFNDVSREEINLRNDKKYMISTGRLVKRKAFDVLIRALQFLNRDDIDLLLIGDGPELEHLKTLAKNLGVEDRIHFLGFVSEEEKFQYLSISDIYVLSSLHEGFGIVLQEAMQVGLPIIATNNGGQVDLVEDGVNGFLVDVGDYKVIASRIIELLENEPLKQRFREANSKKIEQYSAAYIVEKISG